MKVLKLVWRLVIVSVIFLVLLALLQTCSGKAEEILPNLTVTTRLLNGRAAPRKTASIEARFDLGDTLTQTGEWSKNHEWVEVYGGETGVVWVHINYVSERPHYFVANEKHGRVKVRKWPVIGKVTGYIRHGQQVMIEQTVLGWGRTKKGWVDLDYLVEEIE